MAYNPSFPADDGQLADFPPAMREQIRALVEDALVNALKVQGLTPGNNTGDIPISNGTKCTNLNADKLNGKYSTEFATATHTHAAATGSAAGLMSAADFTKLAGIATGAEVNQNAFSNILVNGTTIQADSKTDTFEIIAGTNIALIPDATNDRLTIGVSGTVAAAATCTGNAATATTAAACSGNAATATKWASAKTVSISGKVIGTATAIDGSGNVSIPVTAVTADSCTGNAATATKWATSRTLTLTGDVTGSTNIDGSGNASIATTVTAGMPLGFTFAMLANTPPAGCLALQGGLVSRATYPDLWAWIQTNAPLITEAAWQAQAAAQSSVGAYSSGDGSTTFRLPRIVDFVRGSTTGRDPGTWQDDDLESHTHYETGATGTGGNLVVFAASSTAGSTVAAMNNKTSATGGTETRPKSVSMLYCVKAFGAAVNQGTIDITALANSLVGKLNTTDIGSTILGTRLWISPEYTPALGTPTIVTHNLALNPLTARGEVLLKCAIAELGYSVGDYAINPSFIQQSNGDTPMVPALAANDIRIITGNVGTGVTVTRKDNNTMAQITLANWRYIFRVWY